ncbi:hypothetical protein [Azospirillum sp. SYSU D00513]|nr:hypothetical protein [Azospirillum sp. SYSU D00513]
MTRLLSVLIVLILLAIGGGIVFLGNFWEMPAPSAPVEKVIPDDRFPR